MGKTNLLLYEHASGYGLFNVKEMEEVAILTEQVNNSYQDPSIFQSICSLLAFQPFQDAVQALENANAVSEGLMTPQLKLFLQTNFPKKAKKVTLGVFDPKLGGVISEEIGCTVNHVGAVPEMLRAVRHHFNRLVTGFTGGSEGKGCIASKSQLGLGHSYSRAKVKFNVHRIDNMIIQSIALLDQLDKDVNTFSMRLREWYSFHFPELVKIVNDSMLSYAQCVLIIKDRTEFQKVENGVSQLEEVLVDSAKAQAIVAASKSSMGFELSIVDQINMQRFAKRLVGLIHYRKELTNYLHDKMQVIAPNLAALIGDTIGARLISQAGSLTNLAKYPASTVQILGAEKALFRALKTRGKTPKYGLIYHSTFIGKAGQNRGRISRYLANKCSIASRIDCFAEHATNLFGQKLKEQVEDRLKFYDSGELPKKNIDVMHEAMQLVEAEHEQFVQVESRRQKKKDKKRKREAEAEIALVADDLTVSEEVIAPPKTKKVKSDLNMVNGAGCQEEAAESTPKKRKAKRMSESVELACNEVESLPTSVMADEVVSEFGTNGNLTNGNDSTVDANKKGKKKKSKKVDLKEEDDVVEVENVENVKPNEGGDEVLQKKKKKKVKVATIE